VKIIKKQQRVKYLAFIAIFLSSLFMSISDTTATTPFTPSPPPPATGSEYWDFNKSEVVGWRATQYFNTSVISSVDFIYNISDIIYSNLLGTDYYIIQLAEMYFNATSSKVEEFSNRIEHPLQNRSVINFTAGEMHPEFMGAANEINLFIHNNGSGLALDWCATALTTTTYSGVCFVPDIQINATTSNQIFINDTITPNYVNLIYYQNGTLNTGEIYQDFGAVGYIKINYTRILDFNRIDDLVWSANIGDPIYLGYNLDETRIIIKEFLNVTEPYFGPWQYVVGNYSVWNSTSEVWAVAQSDMNISQANENMVLPANIIPNGTTGKQLSKYFEPLVFFAGQIDTMTYGDYWIYLENSTTGAYAKYSYYPNGILKYNYISNFTDIYGTPNGTMILNYYKNITTLTSGISTIAFDAYDLEDDFNISVDIEVLNDVDFFFSGFPENPSNISLTNSLLYFDLMVNESANLNYPLNITIDYNISLGDSYKLWFFNDTQSVWDWEEIPIIDYYNGTLIASVDHTSVFALTGNFSGPQITINSPSSGQYFNNITPSYNVEVVDGNLDMMWYTIDGGLTNITFVSNGTIIQAVWDTLPNGSVTITFYANDTIGQSNSQSVQVWKDIYTPSVVINIPGNLTYWNTEPPINISATDTNLDTVWYRVGAITENLTSGVEESLLTSIWTSLGQGSFQVEIFANDTAGNLNNTYTLTLYKDTIAPSVTINTPGNLTNWNTEPPINISATDPNLDTIWYRVGVITEMLINGTEENLLTPIWTSLPEGAFQVEIFANDTLGNLNNTYTITLYKDTIAPIITINSPTIGQYFNNNAPGYNVEIEDDNLNQTWYTIDGGLTNIFFISNGTINQTAWTNRPNGSVTITFYANDTLGQINFLSVQVWKDNNTPSIVINTPVNLTYWNTEPPINITATDTNLDTVWYEVGAITENLTSGVEELLLTSIWTSLPEGSFQVEIFANDTAGNLNNTYILTLYKDTNAPSVIINTPANMSYWNTEPPINVSAIDPNLDTIWYRVGGTNETLASGVEEDLLTSIWTSLPGGAFQIEIYANDTFGQLNNSYILTLYKDTNAPSVIINTPSNLTYWNTEPLINVSAIDPNLDTIWYRVGVTNETLVNSVEEFLLTSIWTGLGEGAFQIEIYANDTYGNVNNTYVLTLYKDTITPTLTINAPGNLTYWNSEPGINVSATDSNLDTIWYRVGVTNEILISGVEENLLNSIWISLPEGSFQMEIFANDTAGNLNNTYTLTLYKDTLTPSVIINSPGNLTYWNTEPPINVSVIDPNLDTIWYRVGVTNETLVNGVEENLLTSIWTSLPEGAFQIEIYANDSLGHLNNSYTLTLYKDTNAPSVIINSPANLTYWNAEPPINISAFDPNLDTIWYRVGVTNETLVNGVEENLLTSIWTSLPEGAFQIEIYANDTYGNVNNAYVLTLYKDTIIPTLTINAPGNLTYWNSEPGINVSAVDLYLDTIWYQVGAFTEILNSGVEEILLNSIWTSISEGPFQILIFANDSSGNVNNTYVLSLLKDTTEPAINIISPQANVHVGANAPAFSLSISDWTLNTTWYLVYDGINWSDPVIFNGTSGTINQSLWKSLPEGNIVITFKANDSFGLIASVNITIIKDLSRGGEPPFNLLEFLTSPPGLILIGSIVLGVALIIIVKTRGGKYKSSKKERDKIMDIMFKKE
jgi:hypothetical protein